MKSVIFAMMVMACSVANADVVATATDLEGSTIYLTDVHDDCGTAYSYSVFGEQPLNIYQERGCWFAGNHPYIIAYPYGKTGAHRWLKAYFKQVARTPSAAQ